MELECGQGGSELNMQDGRLETGGSRCAPFNVWSEECILSLYKRDPSLALLRGRFSMIARLASLATIAVLSLVLVTCIGRGADEKSDPVLHHVSTDSALAVAESLYLEARDLHDRLLVHGYRGNVDSARALRFPYDSALAHLDGALLLIDRRNLAEDDRRADSVMRAERATSLTISSGVVAPAVQPRASDCTYDARTLAVRGRATLASRIYECYTRAAGRITIDGETLDRLTLVNRLATTDDRAKRKRLFLALSPVWRSVNGDGDTASPYRQLIALSSREWREQGSPFAASAAEFGESGTELERWLTSILEAWRANAGNTPMEPWDWHYAAGETSRRLSSRIPRDSLLLINRRIYSALGADPEALGVSYDIDPRDGKDPVAFTTLNGRERVTGGPRHFNRSYVSASYRTGGFDNLVELLHESGHAVHLAGIETRPAFASWPTSNTFTEALGDLVALDLYEPSAQMRWLGDSVPRHVAMRAKYGTIVLDVAWALFEVRMHRDPNANPNSIWSALTHDYLGIVPHPEWSWWAMRGQLIDVPGYMTNYALGAILAAEMRAATAKQIGAFSQGDSAVYPWLRNRLYRFGLERSARRVAEGLVGRAVGPSALFDDLRRMRREPSR